MATHESPFKPTALEGQVALVTGGGSGIGLSISRELLGHGARVLIMGRREEVLRAAFHDLGGDESRVGYTTGDVRKMEDCVRAVNAASSRFGPLSILVNCAAGNFLAPADALTSNGFKTVWEIDALGTFHCCQAARSDLARTKGLVVNVSMTLHYGATFFQAHACAAKAAVDSLTRSLALEWGYEGIRVNGVAPGPIAGTAGMAKLDPKGVAGQSRDGGTASRMSRDPIPLGRMGAPWDVAMSVVFLASAAGAYVAGHTIVCDGANWLWKPPVVSPKLVARLSKEAEQTSATVGVAGGGERSRL